MLFVGSDLEFIRHTLPLAGTTTTDELLNVAFLATWHEFTYQQHPK
jgi:hypothetical protein